MPPAPMAETISYGPRRVPGPRDMGCQEDGAIVTNFDHLRPLACGPRNDLRLVFPAVLAIDWDSEDRLDVCQRPSPVALIAINNPPRSTRSFPLASSITHAHQAGTSSGLRAARPPLVFKA